jgi:hypothetical protein
MRTKTQHCQRGHEWTEANTAYVKDQRRCRTCQNEYQKEYYRVAPGWSNYKREWVRQKYAKDRYGRS